MIHLTRAAGGRTAVSLRGPHTPASESTPPAVMFADRWRASGRLLFLERKIRPRGACHGSPAHQSPQRGGLALIVPLQPLHRASEDPRYGRLSNLFGSHRPLLHVSRFSSRISDRHSASTPLFGPSVASAGPQVPLLRGHEKGCNAHDRPVAHLMPQPTVCAPAPSCRLCFPVTSCARCKASLAQTLALSMHALLAQHILVSLLSVFRKQSFPPPGYGQTYCGRGRRLYWMMS